MLAVVSCREEVTGIVPWQLVTTNNYEVTARDSDGTITAIEFNNLPYIPDEVLDTLTSLKDIALIEIGSLSEKMGDLVHLEHIRISSTRLKSFPSSVGTLPNLHRITFLNSQITTVPESFRGSGVTSVLTS